MPPKKKQRTTDSISSHLASSFAALSANKLHPDHLPPDTLLRAYGLGAPPTAPETFHRACPNRWTDPSSSASHRTDAGTSSRSSPSTSSASRKLTKPATASADVIVLDSAEDDTDDIESDDDLSIQAGLKRKPLTKVVKGAAPAKGKGKGKGKAVHDVDKPCSPDACRDNPRCLNWLGQDKWEKDSASPPSLSSPTSPGPHTDSTPSRARRQGAQGFPQGSRPAG